MDDQTLKKLTDIGIALSRAEDREALLRVILDAAIDLTHAEGGTLYLLESDSLHFHMLRNDILKLGKEDIPTDIEGIPLYQVDGSPNKSAIMAIALTSHNSINIEDVYTEKRYELRAVKHFDEAFNYKTTSVLAVPMTNHENDLIGGFQLINARDVKGDVIPFNRHAQDIVESLASQAAIVLTQQALLESHKDLFDAFIRLIAIAIDEKSAYTSRHCQRVPIISLKIADALNKETSGTFADFEFTAEQMHELKIAAWMHDCGKLTTPEYVVDKATKLETIYDRIKVLEERYQILYLDAKLKFQSKKDSTSDDESEYHLYLKQLSHDLSFLQRMNQGGEFLTEENHENLQRIAASYFWEDAAGTRHPWVGEDELKNLSIERGTLTHEERLIINNHAAVSLKMLNELPFPKGLRNVPDIAGSHHEAINGQGYPRGLKGGELSIQARIVAIADVFEALTAADRPYKSAKPIDEVLSIMNKMVENGHLDSEIVNFFIDKQLYNA
jgi:HD-GYP domain-containing protein (c-di-GMP phosphodiesterase class II)